MKFEERIEPCGCIVTETYGHVNTRMCPTHHRQATRYAKERIVSTYSGKLSEHMIQTANAELRAEVGFNLEADSEDWLT